MSSRFFKSDPLLRRFLPVLRWWFPLHLGLALTLLRIGETSPLSALVYPLCGLVLLTIHTFARIQSERLAHAEAGLILQRTLCGLLDGGMALPAALARLTEAEEGTKRVAQSLYRFLNGDSLKDSLKRLEDSHRGTPLKMVWRAIGLAYDRNASVTSALRGLVPLIEKWLWLEKALWSLRKGVALQTGLAVALPWLLVFFLFRVDRSLPHALFNFSGWWAVAACALLWQFAGAALAWKRSSFFAKRRYRDDRDRLEFLSLLRVLLEGGYDIRYAWGVASREYPFFSPPASSFEDGVGEGGFGALLARWAERETEITERFWWRGLTDLYRSQSPLVPYLQAWTQHLEAKLAREMAEHVRQTPTELNVLLIVFNLPPLFLLLFGPLLLSVVDSLN